MSEKGRQFIAKCKAVMSSSAVVTVTIALLEIALAELKRRGPIHREIPWDERRREPTPELPWGDQ